MHNAALPLSSHRGGDGLCPTCLAQGQRVRKTAEHRTIACPTVALILRAVIQEWQNFTGERWGDPLLAHNISPASHLSANRAMRRTIILGSKPLQEDQGHPELFALLRGLAFDVAARIRDEAARPRAARDPPPRSSMGLP